MIRDHVLARGVTPVVLAALALGLGCGTTPPPAGATNATNATDTQPEPLLEAIPPATDCTSYEVYGSSHSDFVVVEVGGR